MIRVQFHATEGAEPTEVNLERSPVKPGDAFAAHVGDRQTDVEIDSVSERGGKLRVRGKVLPFRAWRHDDTIDLWMAGRIYTVRIAQRVARRAGEVGANAPAGDLTAPMPGTVLKINVAPGDAFDAHDPLVIMESMKMEMSLSSPRPGRVAEVLCKVGDLVALGALLAKLEDR